MNLGVHADARASARQHVRFSHCRRSTNEYLGRRRAALSTNLSFRALTETKQRRPCIGSQKREALVDNQPAKFHLLEIEGFRGFKARQQIWLDASAIVVMGPNGTGKTSIFDAIQWLLLGDVARLKRLASPRSGDYIVNRWSETGVATVDAEIRIGDRKVHARRTGDYKGSRFEFNI